MTDLNFLGDPARDRLAGLVMELAAQLHIERARILALTGILVRLGVLTEAEIEALASDQAMRDRARAELDRSLAGLMRIMTESDDAKTPLRDEGKR